MASIAVLAEAAGQNAAAMAPVATFEHLSVIPAAEQVVAITSSAIESKILPVWKETNSGMAGRLAVTASMNVPKSRAPKKKAQRPPSGKQIPKRTLKVAKPRSETRSGLIASRLRGSAIELPGIQTAEIIELDARRIRRTAGKRAA